MCSIVSEGGGGEMKPCGNDDCSISTTTSDHCSFGRGDLDYLGFWEIPCPVCARAFEEKNPGFGPCWPFKEVE